MQFINWSFLFFFRIQFEKKFDKIVQIIQPTIEENNLQVFPIKSTLFENYIHQLYKQLNQMKNIKF